MNRPVLLAVAGWLAAALVATGVGVAAVSLLGEGISDSTARPLSPAEVRRELDRSPEPAETPSGKETPTPPLGAGPMKPFDTEGGTVVARCAGTKAILSSWSPAQGFHAEDVVRGPASTASLTFESDEDEFLVTVTCASGTPQARTQADDRGGGGHRGEG
ncbi:MAG TPA: hypothetical protein VH912_11100 [Streptosporangiaceae bacterium]|jgi:hypothetical protein